MGARDYAGSARNRFTWVEGGRRLTWAEGGAELSADGRHRYGLWRRWGAPRDPAVAWVLLNPSTADEATDDPTVKKCIRYARAWGFGAIRVVNLFALRATDPAALARTHRDDAVGPGNDAALAALRGDGSPLVVAGWGAAGTLWGRDREVVRALTDAGVVLRCLAHTQDGHPWHPLYLPAGAALRPYAGTVAR